ncbi:MAG: pimeloyl-ACP methyl ester carboxylesterase [Cyclobacteriaceae bacterium]|jgi:pimeloyl-ACP methyl ester carboxylesterase
MKSTIRFKKGTKKGTIVMLHGNSSSSMVFDPVFKSELPYSLMAFDLLGHGETQRDGKYGFSDQMEHILSNIATIDDDILLAGNSLGGHLAIEVAEEIKNLKGLLVFGTSPLRKPLNMEEAFLSSPGLSTFFEENPNSEDLDVALNMAVFNKSTISLLKKDFLRADPKVRSVLTAEIGTLSDEVALFSTLSCLKFVIQGDEEPIVNPAYLDVIKQVIHFELIEMKDCGHCPSIEKPDEFVQHLRSIAEKAF